MKEEITKIQTTLLNHLHDELNSDYPDFVEKLKQGKPEDFYDYQEAKKLLGNPIVPWIDLLSSFLDFELGLDFCSLTIEKMQSTKSDRELHFNIRTYSIYLNATLERLENFTKKLVRKNIITEAEHILEFLTETIKDPGLKQERHTAAHGRFIGTKTPIANAQTEHYWEPYSIIQVDEDHLNNWHKSYDNNRDDLVKYTQSEFERFSRSIQNVLRNIYDLLQ